MVVAHAPLISMDFVIQRDDGAVLLGWRVNRPAQNLWFVPGGVIRKTERLDQAFMRILCDEMGQDWLESWLGGMLSSDDSMSRLAKARQQCFMGVYEHHYDDNFTGIAEFGTHYVVLAHRLRLPANMADRLLPKAQHAEYCWLTPDELLVRDDVHRHVKDYFANTESMKKD